MAFAEHAFSLAKTDDKGVSVEAVLRQVEKSTGKRHPILEVPVLPEAAEHVWAWFHEINQGRTSNGFGSNPITWADMQGWSILTGTTIRPWEVRMLRSLDHAWLKAFTPTKNETPEN